MTDMKEKKEKVLYINHSGELLLLLIIVLIFSIMCCFTRIFSSSIENEYKIFMPDVDGLIVGSPVRAMGIEIGNVTKIKPVRDEVYVKFVITDKTITLPQGTKATVEFTGLAGSKSLELYLPDKDTYIDASVPVLTVSSPKRLSDAAGLLSDMFKRIGEMITVTSKFGSKLSEIDFPEKNKGGENPKEFLKFTNKIIDQQQERVDDLWRSMNERKR